MTVVCLDLDDVFVRRDLYQGKYAPDLDKQREFQLEMTGIQTWSDGVIKEGLDALREEL